MAFFEDFANLMKKYNLQLHTIQLDENVAKFNEVFKTDIKKEDLPPPVLLFRTSEGDFIPTVFGPVAARNTDTKFINITDPSKTIDLFPPETEEKKEEAVKEETTEEAKTSKTTKKSSKKADETTTTTSNSTPPPPPTVNDKKREDRILVVGSLFNKENFNVEQYTKFVDENLGKLSIYNTLNNLLILAIGQKNYAENEAIKANSKRGREVIAQLQNYVKDFGKLVLLKGWNKALEARKIVEFAKENNIEIIEQQDF